MHTDAKSAKEEIVKTGTDAKREGLYVSECCKNVKVVRAGDMFPRCQKCLSLTVWEIAEEDVVKAVKVA